MNRGTALLLAMGALLAHALFLHIGTAQEFAAPYDLAHVAYRLARNFVQHGSLAFNLDLDGGPLEGGLESHGSPLLVGLAIVAERGYLPVTTFCQTIGLLAALGTVSVSASFATDRFAGVIPPALLVVSGCFAAAAASGTELPLVAFFLTLAFVSLEHRWRKTYALALAGLVSASPLGVVMAAALFAIALVERLIPRRDRARPMALVSALPALLVAALFFGMRTREGDSLYGSLLGRLFEFDPIRMKAGLAYVLDFAFATAIPLLIVLPLVLGLVGRVSGAGLRALALTLVWAGLVVLQAGGPLAFNVAMAPALPLLCVSIQQGMLGALDTHRRGLEVLCWSLLTLVILVSAIASKYPGDLGPIPAYDLHQSWMTASATAPYGYERRLGRQALDDEIHMTETQRELGRFLRDHATPGRTLLTPWPGAVSYLSGMRVLDLSGRATPLPDGTRAGLWEPRPRTDVLALLAQRPDFFLPTLITRQKAVRSEFGLGMLLELYSIDRTPTPARVKLLEAALDDYELVTLPLHLVADRSSRSKPFYILRRRDLGLAPQLALSVSEGRIRVESLPLETGDGEAARGHPQLAWLQVRVLDEAGHSYALGPRGRPSDQSRVCARTNLLLEPVAGRTTRLADLPLPSLPDGARVAEVRAMLINPQTRRSHPFARVGEEVSFLLDD